MKHPDPEIQALMDETMEQLRSGKMHPDPIEPWWEPRRENEQTCDYLGRVLDAANLPDLAISARAAHYDDYFAPPEVADGCELMRLVRDLRRAADELNVPMTTLDKIPAIENAVRRGEFDATKAESDRWAASKSGQDTFDQLVGVGRNQPCPCGSGRKFKKCCGGAR